MKNDPSDWALAIVLVLAGASLFWITIHVIAHTNWGGC